MIHHPRGLILEILAQNGTPAVDLSRIADAIEAAYAEANPVTERDDDTTEEPNP